ncbi:discoidin domain-containing protein [Steroidobacter cummioxidans]|uniref:galactose-binding domain-containing protein n=1 Tax=Steroidobacter cummioxidans TaxID=1803913 RepID=UPI001379CE98|nr:discoidin domain-containing protein [Steroidobacter cummioxidans]
MKLRFAPFVLSTLVCAFAAHAQDQFSGTAFFMGDPTPSKAQPRYDSFVQQIKQQPNSTNVFIDYREPIWSSGTYDAQWRNNAAWHAGELAKLCSAEHLNRLDAEGRPDIIPVVSVGLTDDHRAYRRNLPANDPNHGKYSEAEAVRMMNDIANGKYDLDDAATGRYRVWPAIFDAFRNAGFRKIYLRVGWEQNGDWYGWQVRNDATKAAYLAAWRHVATVARNYAAAHDMTIETVWSPTASYANHGIAEESSYPGDSYVDIVAPTAYSPIWNATRSPDGTAYYDWSSEQNVSLAQWLANPVNRTQIWDYPAADYWNQQRGWGIPAAISFALEHGKPFGLSETGTGNSGVTTRGGGPADEGDYPLYLAQRLAAGAQQGLQLRMVEIWAQASGSDDATFLSGLRPLEATGWKEFGGIMAAVQAQKDVAKGKPAYASSTQSGFPASYALDGSTETRWSSAPGNDKQWIYVDLGQRYPISRVRLNWDAAHASEYTIQTLTSGTTWTTIYQTSAGDGGVDDVRGLTGLGRYVRIFAHKRGTSLQNYQLREIEVYP